MKRWGPSQQTTQKTLTLHILPQCIIDGWWKRSILMYHNLFRRWNCEMSPPNDSNKLKMKRWCFFLILCSQTINSDAPHYILFMKFLNERPNWLNYPLMSWNWAGNIFPSFWSHFIYSAIKLGPSYQFWCAPL